MIRKALEDGADIIETDLHLTADGAFLCIHDATVDRTTNGTGPVSGMTLQQVRMLSASCGRLEFEDQRVPTLAELAQLLQPGVALALELKTDRFLDPSVCKQLVDELDRTAVRSTTVVLSFSLGRIKMLQSVAPDIPIGWITLTRPFPHRGAQLLGPLWPLLLLNPFYVELAHARSQLVCPLDPQPDSRLRLYRRLGCDAVLSDDPGATLRALGRA